MTDNAKAAKATETAKTDVVVEIAPAKPRPVSLSLPPELVAKVEDARWDLRETSLSGVVRHILEDYFKDK